jgi:2-furoyl-CoA dehydrogenase FAD binding subunit
MKPVAFDYYRPEALSETVALLADKGDEAAILAGGMTLGPMLNLRVVRPHSVIDISRIQALKTISVAGNVVITGAGLTQSEALRSERVAREVPLLAMALPWVGHFQTRNRGTLGGSVAHADPSAEIPLALVACGGTVVLQSRRGTRRLAAPEFFVGALVTQRQADEIVTALEWPRSPPDAGYGFTEIAQRHGDFAIASAACSVRLTNSDRVERLAVGVGGVEDRPIALDVSGFLGHAAGDIPANLSAHAASSVTPIEDRSASADYRTALTKVLVERVVNSALDMARLQRARLQ